MSIDFNLVFEIVIYLSILGLLIYIVITYRNTLIAENKAYLINKELKIKLKLAKNKSELLNQKNILVEEINETVFLNFFEIIKQLLLLQKTILEEH
ncbi:hypothetical protein BWZ22_02875 [Seonamhaeicola sp. S2-3]|uniref:hypothetical protein n=1 Tax=Seonamhaeicola sp. S2-3 TaxID=1936081 RepID=UPI000972D7DD|nr:hypothetical protein [Seonamhaeicola sp. S2-3]APY10242.1 hypothetical protein BWZ22_02875 [Seonamhaeicola sp. S2-3]